MFRGDACLYFSVTNKWSDCSRAACSLYILWKLSCSIIRRKNRIIFFIYHFTLTHNGKKWKPHSYMCRVVAYTIYVDHKYAQCITVCARTVQWCLYAWVHYLIDVWTSQHFTTARASLVLNIIYQMHTQWVDCSQLSGRALATRVHRRWGWWYDKLRWWTHIKASAINQSKRVRCNQNLTVLLPWTRLEYMAIFIWPAYGSGKGDVYGWHLWALNMGIIRAFSV